MPDNSRNKGGQRKFKYDNLENVDSVYNYLATINKGLKNRHLTFGTDDDMIEMNLPDNVQLEIKAKNKEDRASLSIEIKWDQCDKADDESGSGEEAESTTTAAAGTTSGQSKKQTKSEKKSKKQSGKSKGSPKSTRRKAG